jgi:hypothetical protein
MAKLEVVRRVATADTSPSEPLLGLRHEGAALAEVDEVRNRHVWDLL